jgi:hypothetical protein
MLATRSYTRRRAAFSPVVTSRASVPIAQSETVGDMITSIHEASHAAYHALTKRAVFSTEVYADGGGRFRASSLDVAPLLTGKEPPPVTVAADAKSKREWVDLPIGLASPKYAQRKYCGSDRWNCEHDFAVIDRILTGISASLSEKHKLLAEIEARASRFVNAHWFAIVRLANALCARGYLNESEIRAALSRAPSVKLNAAGADLAFDLVSAGKLNWGGFGWDSSDDDDLLDEEDEGGKFYLSEDPEAVGAGKYHYPFTKTGGEVYVQALLDAEKQGGVVAEFAAQLLDKITAMKRQSEANTIRPRMWGHALPRRPGDEENFRRRVDGYFL